MTPYTRLRDIRESHRGAVVGASEIATLALLAQAVGRRPGWVRWATEFVRTKRGA
jgi:hypothetical protein